jgi:hypothetical protein
MGTLAQDVGVVSPTEAPSPAPTIPALADTHVLVALARLPERSARLDKLVEMRGDGVVSAIAIRDRRRRTSLRLW